MVSPVKHILMPKIRYTRKDRAICIPEKVFTEEIKIRKIPFISKVEIIVILSATKTTWWLVGEYKFTSIYLNYYIKYKNIKQRLCVSYIFFNFAIKRTIFPRIYLVFLNYL